MKLKLKFTSPQRTSRERTQMKGTVVSRVLSPLSCLFCSKRGEKNMRRLAEDDAASPMSTARLTEDEDLSAAYKQVSFLSLSSDELSVFALHDDDPCLQFLDDEIETLSCSTRGSNIHLRLGWRQRFNRSFHRIVKCRSKTDGISLLLGGHENSSCKFEDDGFDALTRFSTSTTNKEVILHALAEQVECSLSPPLPSPEQNGKHGIESSLSLSKFIERERQDSMIHLGEISAQDSLSVGSACLAVSFDEDYPQLVMQTSCVLDEEDDHVSSASDSASRDDKESQQSLHLLGAAFAHPAQRQRSTTLVRRTTDRKKPTRVAPGKENLNKVWERIGGGYGSHATALLAPMDCSPSQQSQDSVRFHTTLSWESQEDDMRWSFSNEDSVVSFSSVLENQILQSACGDLCAYAKHEPAHPDNPSEEDNVY